MSTEQIECRLCGGKTHTMHIHLRDHHPGVTLAEYQKKYPDAPVLSDFAKRKIEDKRAALAAAATPTENSAAGAVAMAGVAGSVLHVVAPAATSGYTTEKKAFHEVFELGDATAAKNAKGAAIPVEVITAWPSAADVDLLRRIDPNHVFDVETLKAVTMGVESNIPTLCWGHAGTGKTTTILQVCARTGRPVIRLQHTINTEESHIVGQWTVKKGETVFQLGPLPLAMIHGWVYLADEYDMALPSVLATYQAVMEGEPLYIKEAPPEMRLIRPHPMFRFVATGNTNGSGDETGLYQGTQIQNGANYDRFGITIQQRYMKPELEAQMIMNQAKLVRKDADKLVDFATKVRDAFEGATISNTVSPRALIRAAQIGVKRGNYLVGLNLAFINRLGKVDREAVAGIAQRTFGTGPL